MKMIKRDEEDKQEINTEIYLKKKKGKKREYGENRYRNMSKEKKQSLKEYQKNYREAKNSQYNNEQNSFLVVIVTITLIVMQNKIVF